MDDTNEEYFVEELYFDENNELVHYGTPRHSGRYPWGSGENPYQHSGDWLSRVDELKKKGMTEAQIAEAMNTSTTQYRALYSIAISDRRRDTIKQIKSMQSDGYSNVDIANKLGLKGESSVRALLKEDAEARMNISQKTADELRKIVDEKGMIDIGVGTERELGISREKMNQAIEILKLEGYEVYGNRVPQATNKGKYTTLKVLCKPGTEHKEIYNYDKIKPITDYAKDITRDDGKPSGFQYPASLDSKRLAIRYREDGGVDKDGVIELRRGVKDLSLGESNYAQVRILVDGTHYIKGMAIYSDDLPDGVDVLFNTNKSKSVDKMDVLKKVKNDPDNPFGSLIKENGGQSYYDDPNGEYINPLTKQRQSLSLINKRAEEGDWYHWDNKLPSQFLSKQPKSLIDKQIKLSEAEYQDEYDEIMHLTNPTVKKALLYSFADDCDAAATQLKAASLPGQTYKVILPLTSIKDNEVYAPHLKDGTEVALVRYPHGGTFEIPKLKVNNRIKEGQNVLGKQPADAIGISPKVAERLSGADFDGDTVMVIPLSDKVQVTSTAPLKQLVGFDPKLEYGPDKGPIIDKKGVEHYYRGGNEIKLMHNTQTEMGIISNLITDMTLKGASSDEIARAVKHSMVVIDAEKHHLDYKQSELDNNIKQLKKDYQTQIDIDTDKEHQGASTLISKAKSQKIISEKKEGSEFYTKDGNKKVTLYDPDKKLYIDENTGDLYSKNEVRSLSIDPNTGKKIFKETGRTYSVYNYIDSDGKKKTASVIFRDQKPYYKDSKGNYIQIKDPQLIIEKPATMVSTKMAETDDARTLSSGTVKEEVYANYANKLKSLANEARLQIIFTKDIPYSPAAKETYKDEVNSLNYKLNQSLLNAPKERQAQTIAASVIKAKKQDNPGMTAEEERKLSQQELMKARQTVGAKRVDIQLTPKEWEAIQAGAISSSKLSQIVAHCDTKTLRELAMPNSKPTLSDSKIRRMNSMAAAGYTTSEIADTLGVSVATVTKYLKGLD